MNSFNGIQTIEDVKRYQTSILIRLERTIKGERMDVTTAKALSDIAYKIQMAIQVENKDREIKAAEALVEMLKGSG